MHNRLKKYGLLFLILLLAVLSASCDSGAGVTPACVGYCAGTENEIAYSWHSEDRMVMPLEFVRCFALYTAVSSVCTSEEEGFPAPAAEIVFNYKPANMKMVIETVTNSGNEFLLLMQKKAKESGLSQTVFGSITGAEKSEKELKKLLLNEDLDIGGTTCYSTLSDMKKMAKMFKDNFVLNRILRAYRWNFVGSSHTYTRSGYLLNEKSEYYLETAVLYLSGSGYDYDGNPACISIAVVEDDGKLSFSAVAESGGRNLEMYAACDSGNLCGKAIGKRYDLVYSPGGNTADGGEGAVAVGVDWFYLIMMFLLGAFVVLLILLVVVSMVMRIRRNTAGRKKYCHTAQNSEQEKDE